MNKYVTAIFIATPLILPVIWVTLFILSLTALFKYKNNTLSPLAASWVDVASLQLVAVGFTLAWYKLAVGFIRAKPLRLDEILAYLPRSIANFLLSSGFNLEVLYGNLIGDSLIVLCFMSSLFCMWHLGDRGLLVKHAASTFFSFFLVATTVMTTTTNLLVMFISFEFMFFPSLYFAYLLGYVKKVDRSIWVFLSFTLFGAFIVLIAFAILYSITHTFNIEALHNSKLELYKAKWLYLMFFIGFGIKIPVFPFHYWLTNIHVEAPAGFSMFLSGFLVKTAWYCFYFVNAIFYDPDMRVFYIVWVLVCISEASIKMWSMTDIKMIVAYATIQEMNLLLVTTLFFKFFSTKLLVAFMLMHGVLSMFMFFVVDLLQKRVGTRNIADLRGSIGDYPFLKFAIWSMLIFYLALPFTVKFVLEIVVGLAILTLTGYLGLLIFFIAMFFGAVGFARSWVLMIYGQPESNSNPKPSSDLTDDELVAVFALISALLVLNFLYI